MMKALLVAGTPAITRLGEQIDVGSDIMELRVDWAPKLLERLGFAPVFNSIVGLTAWETAEGGGFSNQARNNPLNTTWKEPGSWNASNTGGGIFVQAYPTEDVGLDATAQTLLVGNHYPGILTALRAGLSPAFLGDAIGASPWGTNKFLMLACIPESDVAVREYWQPSPPPPPAPPPPPKGTTVDFIKTPSATYQFVADGKASYWRAWPAPVAANIPATAVIPDPQSQALALWSHIGADGVMRAAGEAEA